MTAIDVKAAQKRLGKLYPGRIDGIPGPLFWIGLVGFAAPSAAPGGDAVTLRGRMLADVAGMYGLLTVERVAVFLANITHETGDFRKLREDLYYKTADRIRATWPSRFKTLADAEPYVRNAEALANKVYARPKEGNTEPGDGWRYRGGGDFQTTFRNGYRRTGVDIGKPLENHPELIETPAIAVLAGLSFWKTANLAQFADAGQPKRARALANSGDPDFASPIGWTDVSYRGQRITELLS